MISSESLIQQLDQHVSQTKHAYLVRFVVNKLGWIAILSAVVGVLSQSLFVIPIVIAAALLLSIYACLKSSPYRQINLQNLLRHLNRQFDILEESAELITLPINSLNVLQKLQLSKIVVILSKLLADPKIHIGPIYVIKKGLVSSVIVVILLMICGLSYQQGWLQLPFFIKPEINAEGGELENPQSNEKPKVLQLSIEHIDIQVTPPAYTNQDVFSTDDMNITVLSGSRVNWQLGFSNNTPEYELRFSHDEVIRMEGDGTGTYSASKVLNHTGIYSVSASVGKLDSLFSMTVLLDKQPYIRFVTPKKTITEVPKNTDPLITLEAIVGDDFGIAKVDILASIAKGSGEAVKFRDEVFQFDESRLSDDDSIYVKHWNLKDLGMEPGDEFYFSVRAWDNKEPEAQMTVSQTKIVRWLEDDQEGILSDGIVIDFIPEYFKSQRQIIIETLELIASENQLSETEFKKTSQSLGQAQNDLKQKYGQFLGDEFGEGGADVTSADDDFDKHVDEEHEDEDGHTVSEHESEGEHKASEHEHAEELTEQSSDLSGYEQIIARYGHAHGEVDIGLMTKQNPKAMMKRAVAAMWQAELHLLLSEPKLALPFENEALSFLNKAKKAERIYVKRLGFEPPPVTEQRRYQGKLDDIENRQRVIVNSIDDTVQVSITQALSIIDKHRVSRYEMAMSDEEQTVMRNIKQLLLDNTAAEPELIRYVATLEKALLNKSLLDDDCSDCLVELEKRLWLFVPNDHAVPSMSNRISSKSRLATHYLELINTTINDKPRAQINE
jgi:hypothetical protein